MSADQDEFTRRSWLPESIHGKACHSSWVTQKWTKTDFVNQIWLKIGISPSKKKRKCFICFNESLLKKIKNVFYFTLKALFILKIFEFFVLDFGQVEKTACVERNLWRHNLVNKQLQYTYWYTYWPISPEVKATRQWNLVN